MRTEQAATTLFRRCRRGDAEALRTALYSVADGLYAACLGASPGEAEAGDLAVRVWEGTIRGLGRQRGPGDVPARLREALAGLVSAEQGEHVAEAALELWPLTPEEQTVNAPAGLVARLEESAVATAPELRRLTRRRHLMNWVAWGAAGAVVAGLVALSVVELDTMARGRVREVQRESLLASVEEGHLVWNMRDLLFAVPDPQGADRLEAGQLAQAVLMLEELAVAAGGEGGAELPSLRERLADGDLLEWMRQQALAANPGDRATLMQALLVLEEVRAL